MKWFLLTLKRYADFEGRSRRREYGWFLLISVFLAIVLGSLDAVAGTYSSSIGLGLFSGLFGVALFVPGLAVMVRRLHDMGMSGYWGVAVLVPLVNVLFYLLLLFRKGQPGTNQHGSNPAG